MVITMSSAASAKNDAVARILAEPVAIQMPRNPGNVRTLEIRKAAKKEVGFLYTFCIPGEG
jgi:hypothetical protein